MLAEEYTKLKDTYHNCLIGGFSFLFFLSAFFSVGLYMLTMQMKAQHYAPTDAVVVDYVLRMEEDHHDSGATTTVPTYYNIVEYEFNGETYRKGCDTPSSTYNPPDDIGKVITIYVNPKNPNEVVFRNSTHILLITVSLGVPAIGYVIIAFVLRKAYKTKKILNEYQVT